MNQRKIFGTGPSLWVRGGPGSDFNPNKRDGVGSIPSDWQPSMRLSMSHNSHVPHIDKPYNLDEAPRGKPVDEARFEKIFQSLHLHLHEKAAAEPEM